MANYHERDRIAAGMSMVAGVEQKWEQLRLGRVEEGVDLILVLDVGLGMGMKHEGEPIIDPGYFSNSAGRVHQALEAGGVEVDRGERRAGEMVRVHVFDQHQEAGAEPLQDWPQTAQLTLEFGPASPDWRGHSG